MKLFTNEQQKSYKNAKTCYICKKILKKNMLKIKNIVIIQVNIEVLHLVYTISNIVHPKKLS